MAFGSVDLTPGVNSERTPTLLRAGFIVGILIRFKDSLVQKIGGWVKYFQLAVRGIPRDMHAWLDLNSTEHLFVGTTLQAGVITNGVLRDVTPQYLISDFVPNVSTTANSTAVTIVDPNISNVTVYDSVFFNVPVSQGGIILDGLYPITLINGTHSYQITVPTAATTTESNPTATNNTTASGNATLHFASTPSWVAAGMTIYNLTHPASIPAGTLVQSVTSNTVVMNTNAAAPGVSSADSIVFSSVPIFTTTSGNSLIAVEFYAHGLVAGNTITFPIPTTVGGITISGDYDVISITDANDFTIQGTSAATSSATAPMNGGNTEVNYSITIGPVTPGTGYGLGNYGAGAYGFGTGSGGTQTGTPITATDWTSDNWGEILIVCPAGGGIYYYDPTGGFTNSSIISSAPPLNTGIFLSTTEQILVAYGSSVHEGVGWQHEPLLVQWSDVGNFFQWTASAATQAGNFVIPIGSKIIAGAAVSNQNLLWTDLDLWAMNYIGPPDVFGFNKIGAGMGAVSSHAMQQLRGNVFWMSPTNFCSYTGNGANVIPCPVWDAVFQNLNTNFLQNVRAMPNTPFNEVGWLFPSAASVTGECDSYVKFNITEPGSPWDYGIGTALQRSAWIDQTVLGMPIGASSAGLIYQHETTENADGSALMPTFTTGYFYLAEGEDFVVVDQIVPDFKWSLFGGSGSATIQLSFNMLNYPGDTPTTYGPFPVTETTEYVWSRMRGRLMSITGSSADLNSFWRIGSIKYRYNKAGRR
jgi:hypothetical protein